jgi:hypothetical protein
LAYNQNGNCVHRQGQTRGFYDQDKTDVDNNAWTASSQFHVKKTAQSEPTHRTPEAPTITVLATEKGGERI